MIQHMMVHYAHLLGIAFGQDLLHAGAADELDMEEETTKMIALQVRRKMEGETERLSEMLAAHLATQGTGFGGDSDDDMLGM